MEILLTALATFTYEVQKHAATLSLIQKYASQYRLDGTPSPFMEICEQAVEQQLLSLLSKVFDKEETCGKINCSFRTLQKEGREKNLSQATICAIDDLYADYEQIISRDVRNKKLAHIDWEMLYNSKLATVDYSDLLQFIKKTCATINAISKEALFADIVMPNISEIEKAIESEFPFNQLTFKTCYEFKRN